MSDESSNETSNLVKQLANSQSEMHAQITRVLKIYTDQRKRESKWSWIKVFLVPSATILGVLLTLHQSSNRDYRHELHLIKEQRVNLLYRKEEQISKNIDRLHSQHAVLMDAMSKVRGSWSFYVKNYNNINKNINFKLNSLYNLYTNGYKLTGVSYTSTGYLKNLTNKKVMNFESLADVDYETAKERKAPHIKLKALRQLQTSISHDILNQIRSLQHEKDKTQNQGKSLQNEINSSKV